MEDPAGIAEQYRQTIDRLERKLRRNEELDHFKQLLLDQTDPRVLLDIVAEAAARLINAETVAIPILTPDNLHVRYEHAWGKHKEIFLGLSIPVEKAGLCGWVLENRRPIFTNGLQDDPRVLKEQAAALGINTAALAPLIARGRIIGGLSAFNRADGGRFSEEDASDLVKLANYAALIIENANLMGELAREKLKLDAIFEGVSDGIIFISKKGEIKKANKAVERYLPLRADDMVGANVFDLSSMGRLEEVFNWSAKAEPGSRCYEVLGCENTSCLMRKSDYLRCWLFSDGFCHTGAEGCRSEKAFEMCSDCGVLQEASAQMAKPREVAIMGKTLQVSSTIAHDKHDEIFGEIMVVHDITAEKDVERQRLEFMSMVTHDLKAPLTSIIGVCDLISEEKDLGQVREMNRLQHGSSLRLLKMINDFLDLKTIEAGRKDISIQSIEIKSLVEEVVRDFQTQAKERDIRLACEIKEGTRAVLADGECLKRVLENLISNSLKFAGKGRSIRVEARNSGDRSVEIAVVDDGPGISSEDIGRLFQKYFTSPGAKSGAGGSGLGLAIARELTEAQGGSIRVKSEGGKGTTFFISLPAAV